ncbi:MAG: DUF255 domain-containing protein [Deltaproteobacteria bacterium]|nr:DUF255 domain-containing protein [Deltaproteobacteria bacterium]
MAVQLGYENVYRDPVGFPAWKEQGLPVAATPWCPPEGDGSESCPGPTSGLALVWTLLGVFAGGLALNLTPCVYPLIPITVSYFGGQSPGSKARLAVHGLLYLVGLAVTNSLLGVAAALTGGLMGAALQHPVVVVGVALVLVIFASSLFGFWELRLPAGLTRAASRSYMGYFGAFFMGLTLGVVAAPCIGPFVLGLLTWVAGQGSAWLGFIVFFTLSLGLGTPLFVLALFSGSLDRLPRSGEWLLWVRRLMGWVLLAMAAYFLRPLLPQAWGVFLLGAVALLAGLHLGVLDRTAAVGRALAGLKGAAWMAGIIIATLMIGSWALRGPGVAWQPYSDSLLAQAQKLGKPVIIDFAADWCAPCRELEDITFHHPQVVEKAAKAFVMIKVDLTRKGNPQSQALLVRYQVKGVPTVLFLDKNGQECKDLRLVDFLPPEPFLARMDAAAGK